jgi:hypothetical protein
VEWRCDRLSFIYRASAPDVCRVRHIGCRDGQSPGAVPGHGYIKVEIERQLSIFVGRFSRPDYNPKTLVIDASDVLGR